MFQIHPLFLLTVKTAKKCITIIRERSLFAFPKANFDNFSQSIVCLTVSKKPNYRQYLLKRQFKLERIIRQVKGTVMQIDKALTNTKVF